MYSWLILALVSLPTLLMVPMSLSAGEFLTFPPRGISLRWYETFVTDDKWLRPLFFSLGLGSVSATLALLVGALAAWPFARRQMVGRGVVRALFVSPLVIPPICLAVGAFLVWSELGLLGSPLALISTHVMLGAPYAVLLMEAAFRSLDEDQLRAARSLGAGSFALARRIVLPAVLPSALASWIFALAVSLDEVVLTQFILRPGQEPTLSVHLFQELTQRTPVIAVAGTLYLLVAMAIAILATARAQGELGQGSGVV